MSDITYHALELSILGSRNRVDQPDFQRYPAAQAVAGITLQSFSCAVIECRGRHYKKRYSIDSILPNLRFEYSLNTLEKMVEAADGATVGQLDRIIDAADDLLDQRERPPAGTMLVEGRGPHQIPTTIADQWHRQVVEPGAYQLEESVFDGQHLHERIIGHEVVAAMLARADGGYALELTIPVEYPAAEGAFNFPAPEIRKRFG